MLKGMLVSPAYRSEKKPYVSTGPTPKPLQKEPHIPAPSQGLGAESSYEMTAEDEGIFSGALNALSRQIGPVLDALDESLANIEDLAMVAENQMAMATA